MKFPVDYTDLIMQNALAFLRSNIDQAPKEPGIYVFSRQHKFIYVGQATNLRQRLSYHFNSTHNPELALYINKYKKLKFYYELVAKHSLLDDFERSLIQHLDPETNKDRFHDYRPKNINLTEALWHQSTQQ